MPVNPRFGTEPQVCGLDRRWPVPPNVRVTNLSFNDFAEREPAGIAIHDTRGRRWSRGELYTLINQTARALGAAGFRSGDAIAIVSPNCAEYLAVYLAAIQAGLFIVPVNWHLAKPEQDFIIEDSGAKAIFAHERLLASRLAELAARASRGTLLIGIGEAPGYVPLPRFIAGQSAKPCAYRATGRAMSYTSATTGKPKAVLLERNCAESARQRIVEFHRSVGIEPGGHNVHMCTSMLYHAAPLERAVTALHMGHALVLVDRWDPVQALELIDAHRVTTSFMVPSMFVRLLKLPAETRARYSTSSLKFVSHSAAPCPIGVKRKMIQWWGPIIWEGYGATEGQGTFVGSEEWLRFPGTVGRPIPGSEIRIMDDDGGTLPPGEVGSVYLTRFTQDRFEYRNDPEATRACHHGEFFTVGDLGYMNEEGYLFLCDRRTDLIISSGMNIYPAEIEQVLVEHPAVADCAVIRIPHELLGQVPNAVIEPALNVETHAALTADILLWLASRLSAAKLPHSIEYTNALPRDPNG